MLWLRSISDFFHRLATRPTEGLTRWQRGLTHSLAVLRHCIHELNHDEATEMAAALAYRTIFSLIPIAVLSLILFQTFVGFETIREQIQTKAFEVLGLSALELPEVDVDGDGDADAAPPPAATAAAGGDNGAGATAIDKKNADKKRNVAEIISDLLDHVRDADLASLGGIGILVLIWAALALAVTVEQTFDRIYNCPHGRSWYSRLTTYWAVITLGPVLLSISFYVTGRVTEWVDDYGPLANLVRLASQFTAFVATWLLLLMLYVLMPNTKVRLRPALIGSGVAAVLWELAKYGFRLYVTKAVPYSAIYGTLGLLPLFLVWIYLGWLIVLFGLELAFTLQMMKSKQFKYAQARANQDLFYDARCLVPMMAMIGRAFERGEVMTDSELARELEMPLRAVAAMGQRLEEAGLVHRVEPQGDRDPGYALAIPADQVTIRRLLDLSASLTSGGINRLKGPIAAWMNKLRTAQQDVAGEATLAKLLDSDRPREPAVAAAEELSRR